MGQKFMRRTHFKAIAEVTSPANDDKQVIDCFEFFQVGDTVDVVDMDSDGNILSTIADNLTVLAVNPTGFLILDAVVDTTGTTGTPKIINQSIDDGQQAIERLYKRKVSAQNLNFTIQEPIVAQELNAPIAGQTTFDVDDSQFLKSGDTVDVIADEGLVADDVTVVSVNVNADDSNNKSTVVISSVIDTSTFTNPKIVADLSVDQVIRRNQETIDGIDQPLENEFAGLGDNRLTAFEADDLFVQNTSKVFLDGSRMRKGTPGTRGSLTQGTGDSQLIFTSMILGLDGNKTKVAVQSGAGLTVSVSGNFNSGHTITVNDNGGAATSQDIADAVNADATAKRLVQAQFGGDGTGLAATFAATALTGGLDDGVADYAELEQVFENSIVGTGFKWISFHIRPNENNRLSTPPGDDEEVCFDYRKAAVNVNR